MSDRTEDTMPWFRETELSTSGYGGYHTYRIPAVAVAPDGTVLAFCEGRRNGHWDFGEINIVLRRSTDGGAAWLPMQLVAARGEETIGNPCVVVDRDTGAVWLAYCRNNDRVQIMRSEDNGGFVVGAARHNARRKARRMDLVRDRAGAWRPAAERQTADPLRPPRRAERRRAHDPLTRHIQ